MSAITRRPWLVVGLWAAAVAMVCVPSFRLQSVLKGSTDVIHGSPSERVTQTLDRTLGHGSSYVFLVVLTGETDARGPECQAAVESLSRVLEGVPRVRAVRHSYNTPSEGFLGRDGRTSLLLVTPDVPTYFDAEEMTEPLRGAVRSVPLPRGCRAYVTGTPAMYHDLNANSAKDLLRAERIGIPLTLAVLLVVFGAPLAAMLPLIIAAVAMTISLAGLYAVSFVTPVGVFAQNTVSMIGLGVGVDYALFLLSRFRSELAAGRPVDVAVATAVRFAGRALLFSGTTVAIGFLMLFMVRARFLYPLALGGILVVTTAVVASLTLLPALLAIVGPRVNWPRRGRAAAAEGSRWATFWSSWSHAVMARPLLFLAPVLVVLAASILPVLRLSAWNVGAKDLSPDMEARAGYELLSSAFEKGRMGPIVLLLEARPGSSVWASDAQDAVLAFVQRWSGDPRVARVQGFTTLLSALDPFRRAIHATADLPSQARDAASSVVAADGSAAGVLLVPHDAPESADAISLVRDLRRAEGVLPGGPVMVRVGGVTAVMLDFDTEFFRGLRHVVPAVLVTTFVVLLFVFRSLAIPLKATLMNLASVLASYGFLVLVFQEGHLSSLLRLAPPGGLNSFIVLMLFTILFGLSMDYEVFLLSRIREEYDRTGDNARSVAAGLAATGGLITSAALIMVILFGSFGFTGLTATREFGLGLAFAVALDATLIRVVLVPASMALLDRWNWWLPFPPTTLATRREE